MNIYVENMHWITDQKNVANFVFMMLIKKKKKT